jgi:hypothetical protein
MHRLSSGGDSGESHAPLTASGRERGKGKVGWEMMGREKEGRECTDLAVEGTQVSHKRH